MTFRLGFFTRLLDDVAPVERYRNALAQIVHAEELGFDTAWVAQHHFHGDEGGLPSPFVVLAQAAAQTSRIRLATGIVTLPLEAPIRVAEDAAVLSLLSGGRFELGIGSGGTSSSFPPFGHDPADRPAIYAAHKETLLRALRGEVLTSDGGALYPPAPAELLSTLWEATFSASGAARIGGEGHGLLLSRTQPRREYTGTGSAVDQVEIVEAHAAALPAGVPQRVMASRSVLVVDDEAEGRRLRAAGIAASVPQIEKLGVTLPSGVSDEEAAAYLDLHIGTPEQVIDSLGADPIVPLASDVVFQPHPVDPPHAVVLRSLELIAERVAPALGWAPGA
ncbi:putative FMN-dependent luciferase-like monooxygenase [Schumannella luteola]|uniref:Putative FMN-dependent luciferase-like monooxygenase n=1 Tax=Schumannella luteola TaxID=472059 RepID=A0A852YLB0_9MICO|nr:putative FMN-dependent luciferase-like monooxygenase [Schumannella luteola]NYG98529.1 putative FMN-dependent luciferase-like monooxygenase [Schumannella luteola]TPX01250.1 putative FMN-dependent luciferase-like monooxygenase [Schumannella luteola]